jgi:hypothetical protein
LLTEAAQFTNTCQKRIITVDKIAISHAEAYRQLWQDSATAYQVIGSASHPVMSTGVV